MTTIKARVPNDGEVCAVWTALELIASGFPGEEFYGSAEQVERAEQVAREALGWHWHVTYKGTTLYDDVPTLFFSEQDARHYKYSLEVVASRKATSVRVMDAVAAAAALDAKVVDCHDLRCVSMSSFNHKEPGQK